ncbi:MAG: YccF domain-containing protein [Clostridia bacterium]|nr:YccF domain-containing protein [Clostridia bacterium]
MKTIANILWIIFGGLVLSAFWAVVGIVMCVTIVGIPFGTQCFKFANLMLFPFGREVVYGESTVSVFLNILWIAVFGLNLALWSLVIGALWCVTIVGIPVGLQVFKFAKLALMPFGARII